MFARRAELLEREAETIGGLAVPGDVTSSGDLERLVATPSTRSGGVDILVNNSGGPPRATATGLDAENVAAGGRPPARLDRASDGLSASPIWSGADRVGS